MIAIDELSGHDDDDDLEFSLSNGSTINFIDKLQLQFYESLLALYMYIVYVCVYVLQMK